MKTWAPEVVVAATDGSEGSIRACHVAVNVARAWGSKLLLVTVVRPPEGWWGIGGAPPTATALSNALDNAQQEALDRTIESLDLTDVDYETVEELGDPAATIVGFCEQHKADLLVIGRRGAGLIERFILGSVADRLVHYAPCPVMVIPPA
jgi:nucleotide-binding universal stress UspA family protein